MTAFHPSQLGRGDQTRLRAYTTNLDFYNGKQWPGRRANNKTRRLTMNYARTLIEKTAAYVMAGRTVRVLPPNDSPEAAAAALAAQHQLADISDQNAVERLDFDTEVDTSVLGDGAFRLSWSDVDARVLITAPDVQGIFAWPKPHLLTDYDQVAHRYTIDNPQALAALGAPTTNPKATIVERWTDAELELWVDNTKVSTTPNPYGLIPYVIFPNSPVPKQFWGLSDIAAIREPALELNRELTVLSAIMEVSGNPIAVLQGVDQANDITTEAGATWTIPAEAKAYLLDLLAGGGVNLHIEYLNAIYRTLHDLSESPRTTFGDTARALSGVALEIELQPLLQKVARKRLIRTEAYRRRARVALAIHDHHVGTHHADAGTITVSWGEVTPEDKTDNANREIALFGAALSSAVASLSRLGAADPEQEWKTIQTNLRELATARNGADERQPPPQPSP
jgi:hypothetical protein